MKVLIADSNRDLLHSLARVFLHNNDEVKAVFDGVQVIDALNNDTYDILLLNKNIQRITYERIMQHVREKDYAMPILLILDKAYIDLAFLKAPALADEYITVPFHVEKLFERVKDAVAESKKPEEIIEKEGVTLSNKFYFMKAEEEVHMSVKEYLLMKEFLISFGEVKNYQELLNCIGKTHTDLSQLWTYINALNEKLKAIKAKIKIDPEVGKGYKLVKNND
ncbi:MAG: response regulator [Bacilli bacterium]|nr:response regulator [Bacilli bacterium]